MTNITSDKKGTVFTFNNKGLPTPIGKVTNVSIGGMVASGGAIKSVTGNTAQGGPPTGIKTIYWNGNLVYAGSGDGVELIDLSQCKPHEMVSNFKFDLLKAVTMVEALPCVDGGCRNATANGRRTCARCEAVEHLKYLCKGG